MPLDAAIGQVFIPYCPDRRHGHQFQRTKSSCGVVKLLFEASVQNARNEPSTQLIEVTSCVERWYATIKAEELT
jgi:DNA-directed RNA polymerase subunit M/transcription elongation factor TFIIS